MVTQSRLPLRWQVAIVALVSLLPLGVFLWGPRLADGSPLLNPVMDGFLVIALCGFSRAAVAALLRERNFAWKFNAVVIGSSILWFPTLGPPMARLVYQALGQP